jgi:hypothetical protein
MRTRLHTCINTVATELNSVMRTRLHTCIFINTEATESKLHTLIDWYGDKQVYCSQNHQQLSPA